MSDQVDHPDFRIENHGSIILLRPISGAAKEWVDCNLPVERQEFGRAVVIEPRCLADIVEGFTADGLTFEGAR